jgi:hypothetical protein
MSSCIPIGEGSAWRYALFTVVMFLELGKQWETLPKIRIGIIAL